MISEARGSVHIPTSERCDAGEEPIRSEIVANAQGNIDWWIARHSGVHLKATAAGQIFGVVLVKNHWNLRSLFVAPSSGKVGRRLLSASIAECSGQSPAMELRFGEQRCDGGPTRKRATDA